MHSFHPSPGNVFLPLTFPLQVNTRQLSRRVKSHANKKHKPRPRPRSRPKPKQDPLPTMPLSRRVHEVADGIILGIAIGALTMAAIWYLVLGAKRWQDPSSAALSPQNLNLLDLRELQGRVLA
ncbi:hypothetical protein PG984_001666 [Apiospora sp. TS-2023a]